MLTSHDFTPHAVYTHAHHTRNFGLCACLLLQMCVTAKIRTHSYRLLPTHPLKLPLAVLSYKRSLEFDNFNKKKLARIS